MILNKIKKFIFNPVIVLIQSIIPMIFLVWSIIVSAHIIESSYTAESFLRLVFLMFLDIPFKLNWIYPLVSLMWSTANFIYSYRKQNNRILSSISLSIAIFNLLGCLFLYIYFIYLLAILIV